jgi:hypothetical protein
MVRQGGRGLAWGVEPWRPQARTGSLRRARTGPSSRSAARSVAVRRADGMAGNETLRVSGHRIERFGLVSRGNAGPVRLAMEARRWIVHLLAQK